MSSRAATWCVLLILPAAAGLLIGRERSAFSFSFPSFSSSSSSSSSSSFERSGAVCLNGGTSVPSLTSGEHMFCLCADGFQGRRCETGAVCLNGGTSVPSLTSGEHMFCLCANGFQGRRCETAEPGECYEGVGLYYRGTASLTVSGRRCEFWDEDSRRIFLPSDVHSGRHNYCRNLHYKLRPWCYVRENQQLVSEYCDVPRCSVQPLPAGPPLAPTEPTEPPPAESTCGERSRVRQMKIVGGTVTTVTSQPWIAAIFWRSRTREQQFRCGGSLIAPCWVLTAAHCFPDGSADKPRRFSVILGKNAVNESDPTTEQKFRVEGIVRHAEYDNSEGNFNNDIALVKLRATRGRCARHSDAVRPVCLPPLHQTLLPGTTCEVVGYGKEKFGVWFRSQYLKEAQVDLISADVCGQDQYHGNKITDNMLCAAGPDWSRDACQEDSGGPLVCEVAGRLFLFGVVSWGEGCAWESKPGVYTKVTNYNTWVAQKTGLATVAAGAMFPQK